MNSFSPSDGLRKIAKKVSCVASRIWARLIHHVPVHETVDHLLRGLLLVRQRQGRAQRNQLPLVDPVESVGVPREPVFYNHVQVVVIGLSVPPFEFEDAAPASSPAATQGSVGGAPPASESAAPMASRMHRGRGAGDEQEKEERGSYRD